VARDITTQIVIQDVEMVVKELLENALDAGATEVACVLTQGGTVVEMTDNGPGISFADMGSVGASHSTSKLSTLDDLKRLETYGFRGEGLHAIATQGVLRVLSRVRGAAQGYGKALSFAAGAELNEPVAPIDGLAEGTVVRAEQLFATLPVRRQVLLEKQEAAHKALVHMFTCYALARPDVCFRLEAPPRPPFSALARESLEERFAELYGPELLAQVERMRWASEDLDLLWEFDCVLPRAGLASYEHAVRSKPRSFALVNRRPVKLDGMTKLVNRMFRAHAGLSTRKYPFMLLSLTLPTDSYDINLSVEKSKINLLHEERLLEFLTRHLEDRYPALDPQRAAASSGGASGSSGAPGVGGALEESVSPLRGSRSGQERASSATPQRPLASAASTATPSPGRQQGSPLPGTQVVEEVFLSPLPQQQQQQQQLQQQQQQQNQAPPPITSHSGSSSTSPPTQAPPQPHRPQQIDFFGPHSAPVMTIDEEGDAPTAAPQRDRQQGSAIEREATPQRLTVPRQQDRDKNVPVTKSVQRKKTTREDAAAISAVASQPAGRRGAGEDDDDAAGGGGADDDFANVVKRQKVAEPEVGRVLSKDVPEVNFEWMTAQARALDTFDARYRGLKLAGVVCQTQATQRVVLTPYQLVSARVVGVLQDPAAGFLAMVDGSALVLCDSLAIAEQLHFCSHVGSQQVPTAPLSELVFVELEAIGSTVLWELVRTNQLCQRIFQKNGFVMDTRYYDTRVNQEVVKISSIPRCVPEEACREVFVELLKLVGAAHVAHQLSEDARLHPKAVLEYFRGEARRLAHAEVVGVPQKAQELLNSLAAAAALQPTLVRLPEADLFRRLFHFSHNNNPQ
jgi:DNA mismatch repair protein MutL